MRRYTILAVALVAMLATACVRSEGTMDRQPIDIGKEIARQADSRLEGTNRDICWALAADMYLSTESEDLRALICENIYPYANLTPQLSENRDSVFLVYNDSGRVRDTYTTNGKLLSEGGEWDLGYAGLTLTAVDGIIELRTNDESGNQYKLNISNWSFDTSMHYELSGSVSYVYNTDLSKTLTIEIEDVLHYTSKRYRTTYSTRELGFYDGVINATYTDSWAGYNDEVKMTYGDENEKSITVEYLDERATISK